MCIFKMHSSLLLLFVFMLSCLQSASTAELPPATVLRDRIVSWDIPPSTSSTTKSPPSANNAECGRVDNSITPFILGGTKVSRGQFPWLVALYKKKSRNQEYFCAGSLISTRTVLSAAVCTHNLNAHQIVTFIGRHNLDDFTESNIVIREIEKLLIHPDYKDFLPDANIALMQLLTPVSFNADIKPICLWSEPDDENLIVGQTGVVAGWGIVANVDDEQGFTPQAKFVETDIVSLVECLFKSDAFRSLTSLRTFCAGKLDGTGPCIGDTGAGLMIKRDGRWMIRGIVSSGLGKNQKCDLHNYVVYCDVAKHATWIKDNVLN